MGRSARTAGIRQPGSEFKIPAALVLEWQRRLQNRNHNDEEKNTYKERHVGPRVDPNPRSGAPKSQLSAREQRLRPPKLHEVIRSQRAPALGFRCPTFLPFRPPPDDRIGGTTYSFLD